MDPMKFFIGGYDAPLPEDVLALFEGGRAHTSSSSKPPSSTMLR